MNTQMQKINQEIIKVLIIYDNELGIKKSVMALSRGLEAGKVQVDCISIQDIDKQNLKDYHIIAIGAYNHKGKTSRQVKPFLKEIKKIKKGKKGAIKYNTKFSQNLELSIAKRIIIGLNKLDLKIYHPTKSCPGCVKFPCENVERFPAIIVGLKKVMKEYNLNEMEEIGLEIAEKLN
ncbi:MAG: hypothetical protein ACTSO9_14445 [Candidatus Helarchaeota archaeon]